MRFPRVLIVEDEVILRKYIVAMLLKLDCKIIGETSFGEEALVFANEVEPDLILMDIRLKGQLDGLDTARQINEDRNIPVAFISAYDFTRRIELEQIPGTIGFLNKPPDQDDLEIVVNMIRKKTRNS